MWCADKILFAPLLHENKVDGSDKTAEGCQVVPVQPLPLEQDVGDDSEDDERHALLNHLELYERERSSVASEPDAIGRHLAAILQESYRPTECYHADEGPVAAHPRLLQLEVSVPCKSHKHIAKHQ